jgi:hypothetical protein
MVKLFIFIFFILFLNCIKNNHHHPEIIHEIDPEFNTYLTRFESHFGSKIDDITIIFGCPDNNKAAVCYYETRVIEVDPVNWDNSSDLRKEQLIFHELGHCVLRRFEHIDTHTDGCPDSIMRSYTFTEWEIDNCYEPDHDFYINELFN